MPRTQPVAQVPLARTVGLHFLRLPLRRFDVVLTFLDHAFEFRKRARLSLAHRSSRSWAGYFRCLCAVIEWPRGQRAFREGFS